MQCSFRVDQKVVCVNPIDDLRRGGIYTITAVRCFDGEWFVGVDGSVFKNADFFAYRFRPLAEPGTETGMSILRDLLNTQDKPLEVV